MRIAMPRAAAGLANGPAGATGLALSAIVRVVATLSAFALGVFGFQQAYAELGGPHSLGECAYNALQLIVGQFPDELSGRSLPITLQIARWALPLITFWATVTLAWRQVRNPVRRALIVARGEHLVLTGDALVAGKVAKGERQAKRPVLVWAKDSRQAWIDDAADAGAAHGPDIARLGLAKARSVLIAGPDDAANVALASAAIDAALGQRLAGDPLTVIARIDDPDLRAPLERRYDWGHERSLVRMRFASLPDIAARQMFLRLPLDRFQHGDEPERAVFFIGFSPAIERYVVRLLAAAHFKGGAKPRMIVLDAGATRRREVFFARRPGAAALAPVVFEDAAVDQPALVGQALDAAIKAYGAPTAVFVDPGDESRALAVAMAVETRLRQDDGIAPPIYVRLPLESGDGELACEITPIGDAESLADPELLLQERLDALARSTHEFYLEGRLEEGDQIGSRSSMYEWDQLPEAMRDDNRLLTDCYELKLRDVGARLVEGGTEAGGFRFEGEELEALSRAEHDRWMGAKLIDGWKFGAKRDDEARLHPDIIPYDDLSEPRKELDREQIRMITRLLSSTGRRAVRDLVVALEPAGGGEGPLLTAETLAAIAAQYPDRAVVVLGAFDEEATRAALLAADAQGAVIQLTLSSDPEAVLTRRPRSERAALRRLYRKADRIFALPKAAWNADKRLAFIRARADLRLTAGSVEAGATPTIRVDGRGAIVSAPWVR